MSKIKIPWSFIKSTTIVLFISTVASLGISSLGGNFWASFALFFTIQYVIFSFLASIIKSYFIQKTKQKELDTLEPLSTILGCAYCNTDNLMTFLPSQNERAEFTCTNCTKTNLVNIQFVVARITEPVAIPNATGIPLKDIENEK